MFPSARKLTLAFLFLTLCILAGSGGLIIALQQQEELSRFSTDLSERTSEQRANILLAAEAIDGAVLKPGEVFSFNRAVGPCTPEQGFLKAPAIIKGEEVMEWGGGICQVSSTLYNAALLADLEIVERRAHSRSARSVPPGRDAAVMYERFDLKIRNSTPYSLRLTARIAGDRLTIAWWGKRPKGQSVRLETVLNHHPLRALVYRVVCRDGQEIRQEKVSEDIYRE